MYMAKKRILIVEDTRIIAMSIKSDLEDIGYEVIDIIDNGQDAIDSAIKENPDLILMDINIKGNMDGIVASERILKQKDIPIVYLTAYTDNNTTERAKRTSPYGYIIKPYEEKTLEITIDFALYKHQQEKKFKKIFNSTHDGLAITDNNGEIIQYNNSSLIYLDIIAQNESLANALKVFGNTSGIDNYFKELKEGNPAILNIEIFKDNNVTTVEIKGTPTEFDGNEVQLHIIRDISVEKDIQRRIFAAMLETEEREKKRFAEELHDGVGPLLSTFKNYLNTLSEENEEERKTQIISRLYNINDEVVRIIKEISNDLRPHLLKNFGFNSATSTFICKMQEAWSNINFSYSSALKTRFNESVEVSLFRIVSELTNNSLKHAHPKNISISLNLENDNYLLKYSDDGIGFEPEKMLHSEKGMGLQNIINRVSTVPGQIEFYSAPDKGFTCEIRIHKRIIINN